MSYTKEQRALDAATIRRLPGSASADLRAIADRLDPPPARKETRGERAYLAYVRVLGHAATPWTTLSDIERRAWEDAAKMTAIEAIELAKVEATDTGGFDGECG